MAMSAKCAPSKDKFLADGFRTRSVATVASVRDLFVSKACEGKSSANLCHNHLLPGSASATI
jgi:hypothetical protein